jgi:hypothetical protein
MLGIFSNKVISTLGIDFALGRRTAGGGQYNRYTFLDRTGIATAPSTYQALYYTIF